MILSRVEKLHATNTTTRYKVVLLSLNFNSKNYKGNHVSLYINLDDMTIFQYSIQKWIENTIYSLAIFSRVVPLGATNTNTETKYKVVRETFLCITTTEIQGKSYGIIYVY